MKRTVSTGNANNAIPVGTRLTLVGIVTFAVSSLQQQPFSDFFEGSGLVFALACFSAQQASTRGSFAVAALAGIDAPQALWQKAAETIRPDIPQKTRSASKSP